MKAVLVGTMSSDKLYYVIDAKAGEKDGAVVRPNGKVIKVDFMSFIHSSQSIRKIRTSRFHRSLWDAPKNLTSGAWYETFISKTKEVNEGSLDGAVIQTSLGSVKKNLDSKTAAIAEFLSIKSLEQGTSRPCCGEMVKFDSKSYFFNTEEERKQAWAAMKIMRQLEE
jgi:hypothetical protein